LTSEAKPKNLSGTTRLLKEMARQGELKVITYSPTDPQLYHLPVTGGLKQLKLKHELLCGNLYVAYDLTWRLNWWEAPLDYDSFGLKPDRRMIWDGRLVFWEVDRGTEDYHTERGIKGKLDRYAALAHQNPDRKFKVCFTTTQAKQSAEARCQAILDLITSYDRGDQFMVTLHKWAVAMPDLACFMTASNPMGVSLSGAS
jgi:Replication-relaxation